MMNNCQGKNNRGIQHYLKSKKWLLEHEHTFAERNLFYMKV
jgi:hypothetical protein